MIKIIFYNNDKDNYNSIENKININNFNKNPITVIIKIFDKNNKL